MKKIYPALFLAVLASACARNIYAGTAGSVPKWTSSSNQGNSIMTDDGSTVTVRGNLTVNGILTSTNTVGVVTGTGQANYFAPWTGTTNLSSTTSDGNIIFSTGAKTLSIHNNLLPNNTFYFDWTTGAFGVNAIPSNISSNRELIRANASTPGNGSNDSLDIIVANQGTGGNRVITSAEGSVTESTMYMQSFGSGQPGNWWTGGPTIANSDSIELQLGTAGQLWYAFSGSPHTYFINESTTGDWQFGHGFPPTMDFVVGYNAVTSSEPFTAASSLTAQASVTFSAFSIVQATGTGTVGTATIAAYTETIDRLNEFNGTTFTVTTAGFYEVSFNGYVGPLDDSSDDTVGALILKNGVSQGGQVIQNSTSGLIAAGSMTVPFNVTRIFSLSANDTISTKFTTTPNTYPATYSFSIRRIP